MRLVEDQEAGPIGTVTGTLVGSLIGALAGPAGLAVGATLGSLGGMWYDVGNAGVGAEFIDDVAILLSPGKFAVVAEVMEEWTTPLDIEMAKHDGVVIRSARMVVRQIQLEREMQAAQAELQQLDAEWNWANDDIKAQLKGKIDKAREKLKKTTDNTRAKIDDLKKEASHRIDTLKAKVANCEAETSAKLEKRVEDMQRNYDQRVTELEEAWNKAVEDVSAGAIVS